ncbi:MAG: tRNA (adenosine(37)-N6)-dimethylallyltransferase MiaA [Tenericutes bacterium]|nr:tRNA (adenosine(37)-N6)-dimethylallyltransferase MiaA [Mycoplasmatota bacterium]
MIIVITGPTGVGKTKLSINLAKKYDAVIINADAMQVYKGLDIGTAKVKKEEMENIEHYLIDILDISKSYSIYDYQKDGRKIIDKFIVLNKNIIIVGGSALYIKALLYNYTFKENMINNNYDNISTEELYERLIKLDKDIDVDRYNRRRIIRALNYYLENGTSINENDDGNELLYKDTIFIGLTTSRDKLYDLINKRVDNMINEGLINEVKYFYDNNLIERPLLTGIGYKEVISYFKGDISYEEMVELIKKNSRHYAKRQYTFMNNKMDIKWFEVCFSDFNKTVFEIEDYIDNIKKDYV